MRSLDKQANAPGGAKYGAWHSQIKTTRSFRRSGPLTKAPEQLSSFWTASDWINVNGIGSGVLIPISVTQAGTCADGFLCNW
jgi:hypothetical protein